MRSFLALLRKEAMSLFCNPPLIFASAFFTLLDSFAFCLETAGPGAVADFTGLALFILFTSMAFLPLAAMQSFASEQAEGTLETLFTAPVGPASLVFAKYGGAMLFAGFHLLPAPLYAFLLSRSGNLDAGAAAAACLVLVLFASFAVSLGVAVSAIANSPAAAAAGSGAVLLFLAAVEAVPDSGVAGLFLNSLGFIPHARKWMDGQVTGSGFFYFISATLLFLFWAWLAVSNREGGGGYGGRIERRRAGFAWFLAASGLFLFLFQAALLHVGGGLDGGRIELRAMPAILLLPAPAGAILFVLALVFRLRAGSPAVAAGTGWTRLAALAALAVAVNVNWLAARPWRVLSGDGRESRSILPGGWRWDVTDNGRNTLSPAARRILADLRAPLAIHCFIPASAETGGVEIADGTRRLADRFREENPLVALSWADPELDPEGTERLAGMLGIGRGEYETGLVAIDYQGRRRLVPAASLAVPPERRTPETAGEKQRWLFDGENRLIRAIADLLDPRVPNFFFSHGHRELSPAQGARRDRSASRLAQTLEQANLRVRQCRIAAGVAIPPECDVLVVAAPRTPFQQEEAEQVRRYLDRGGRLLLFPPEADPNLRDDALAELAFSLGGGWRQDRLEDARNNDNGQVLVPLGTTGGLREEATEEERRNGFSFPLARSIRDNPRSGDRDWRSERLVRSFPSAEAADEGGARRQGPFTLAFRSWKGTGGREARAVVVASGRMAADSDIGRGANEALILGLAHWLAGREDGPEAIAAEDRDRRLRLSPPELRAVLWLGTAVPPLAWLALGILIRGLRRD
ncbi:MAG: Gldg family protein [Planctomycetota bacterium]|jgi:ABC-2 type transport system permease protein|nr:Gldg family protein [Planctomycetota bacterium]